MHKRALVRRIEVEAGPRTLSDRWRDAVFPGSPPSASDDLDFLPCDISLDFSFRGADRGLNVPSASVPGTIIAPLSLFLSEFAIAMSIREHREKMIYRLLTAA
jgi:hypothetical protein